MIDCRGITVWLDGRPVLRDLDMHVARGEWLSLVGPNGAGKSTLLRCLAGLVPGRGEVRLAGRKVASLSRRDRAQLVAFVPQSPVFPEGFRVADYVLLGRTPHIPALGIEGPADLAAAQDALARLDLLGLADRVVTTLSGGERQRVLLARALAQEAPILLLDEPTTALDLGRQQQVLGLVDRLRRDLGLTVVMAMHDLTLASQYADRLVLLAGGRVVVEGVASDVVTEENLARYYGAQARVTQEDGRPVVLPARAHPP